MSDLILLGKNLPLSNYSDSGHYTDRGADKAFDDKTTSYVYSWYVSAKTNQYMQVDLVDQYIVSKIRLIGQTDNVYTTRNPKNCILQGSNDGVNFVDIYSFTAQQVNTWQTFEFSNREKYSIYRLFIIDNYGDSITQIFELDLYGSTSQNKTLVLNNGEYYKYDTTNSSWINLGLIPTDKVIKEDLFDTSGMLDADITVLNSEKLALLGSNNLKLHTHKPN